jgi:hypothetical protein
MNAREFIEAAKAKPRPIRRKFKDIGQQGYFICELEAVTFMPQSDLPEKIFMLERMKWLGTEGTILYPSERPVGRVQYRLGYYMKAEKRQVDVGAVLPDDLPRGSGRALLSGDRRGNTPSGGQGSTGRDLSRSGVAELALRALATERGELAVVVEIGAPALRARRGHDTALGADEDCWLVLVGRP